MTPPSWSRSGNRGPSHHHQSAPPIFSLASRRRRLVRPNRRLWPVPLPCRGKDHQQDWGYQVPPMRIAAAATPSHRPSRHGSPLAQASPFTPWRRSKTRPTRPLATLPGRRPTSRRRRRRAEAPRISAREWSCAGRRPTRTSTLSRSHRRSLPCPCPPPQACRRFTGPTAARETRRPRGRRPWGR